MDNLPTPTGPATRLQDAYLTLRTEPLTKPEEFRLFYRPELNRVRGSDTVTRLAGRLRESYHSSYLRAFLMGHPGVGKSTEVTRLLDLLHQHVGVRLSVASELDPVNFKIFDVLLLMMIRLAEAAREREPRLIGNPARDRLISGIENWFGDETVKELRTRTTQAELKAGAGIKGDTFWSSLFGLFASAEGTLRYAADRKVEVVQHQLRRINELVDLCNDLIDVCAEILWNEQKREWVFIVEDLDKLGISPQQLEELFVQYGNAFQALRVNMIFAIPVWLAYSPECLRLSFDQFLIHDMPVFNRSHEPHDEGRAAIRAVLEARVSPVLFSERQMTRLIVASGGNLRDLFKLVRDAGESAYIDGRRTIEPQDTQRAMNELRRQYRNALGQSPYDPKPITWDEKAAKLMAVYKEESGSRVPDPALYTLLNARAVQEFNGESWFGVHPLVVDLLKREGRLQPHDPGGTD